ncbi:MAG: hypothetical protein L0Y66_09860 [Myxococcaceae bacterium]|nr:hypothetical protein [Myxococcaceae bacterium]MCI0673329.1 hypothetical protein [Myxococcaceae bacterium]
MKLVIEVPLKTKSANVSFRGGWQARARTARSQRDAVRRRLPREPLPALVAVRLTRLSRGKLDTDNLNTALKHVRDQVACWLGLDDASPLVRWEYRQATGAPGVRVEVEFAGPAASIPGDDQHPERPEGAGAERIIATPGLTYGQMVGA